MGCVFIMAVIILLLWKTSWARYSHYIGPRESEEKAADYLKLTILKTQYSQWASSIWMLKN
jgi:hypothetical protein